MKALWLQAVKNWKTTATGLATILIWVLDEVFKFGLTTDQKTFITSVLIGIGLFLAKDQNQTGI